MAAGGLSHTLTASVSRFLPKVATDLNHAKRISRVPASRRNVDGAWSRYYRVTIAAELARTALANNLVHVAKNGVADEDQLAARSPMHLIKLLSLTALSPVRPLQSRIDRSRRALERACHFCSGHITLRHF
jgi:hypothetical protein